MASNFPKFYSEFGLGATFHKKVDKQGYNTEYINYKQLFYYLKTTTGITYHYDTFVLPANDPTVVFSQAGDAVNSFFTEASATSLAKGYGFKTPANLEEVLMKLREVKVPNPGVAKADELDYLQFKVIFNATPGTLAIRDTGVRLDVEVIGKREFHMRMFIPYHRVDPSYPDEDYAFIISTTDPWTYLYILSITNFSYSGRNKETVRQILDFLYKKAGNDPNKLDILYLLTPPFYMDEKTTDELFEDLGHLLKSGVNEIGTDEESAVLNILMSLTSPARLGSELNSGNAEATRILDKLVSTEIDAPIASEENSGALFTKINQKSTLFALLYQKMNDYGGENNFTAMVNQLFILWLLSEYALEGTFKIDYSSEKTLGFYVTSHSFVLSDDSKSIGIIHEPDIFVWNYPKIQSSTHVFRAMELTGTAEVEVAEQEAVPDFMPAFYLKALDDKNASANLETGIFLAIDVLTALTGFGNLLKFGKLFNKLNIAYQGLNKVNVLSVINVAIAGVEVSSGVVGAMFTLAGDCDSKFCRGLRTCLFYMDMISLGADAVVSRLLKKSAREALDNMKAWDSASGVTKTEHTDVIWTLTRLSGIKMANSVNDLKSIDEAIEKLKKKNPKFEIKVPANKLGYAQSANRLQTIFKNIKKKKPPKHFDPNKAALKKEGISLPVSQKGLGVCVDLAGTKYLYPVTGTQKNIVKIKLTGNDYYDKILAEELSGIALKDIEGKYTWHHLDDFDPITNTCTMQLVDMKVHKYCAPHIGAVEIVKNYYPEASLYANRNKKIKI
jgi:hypothetical protein